MGLNYVGILNITPNSFSDGGMYNSVLGFSQRLNRLLREGHDIIDLGAESTAPMNEAIKFETELKRFDFIFKQLEFLPPHQYSIDTYRQETFLHVKDWLSRFGDNQYWWNDISGSYERAIELLNEGQNFKYVFTHSFIPRPEQSGEHMQFTKEIDAQLLLNQMYETFSTVIEKFQKAGFEKNLILDPGFGFSKSREQNLFLLEVLPTMIKDFGEDIEWLIGISRKSFLRTQEDERFIGEKRFEKADYKQAEFIKGLVEKCPKNELFIRLHRVPSEVSDYSKIQNSKAPAQL